jgi:hypothetical protein
MLTSFDNVFELNSRLSSFAAMPPGAGAVSDTKVFETADCMGGQLDRSLSFFSLFFKASVPIRS